MNPPLSARDRCWDRLILAYAVVALPFRLFADYAHFVVDVLREGDFPKERRPPEDNYFFRR